MAWHKGSAYRNDAPSSAQRIRVNTYTDPVDGNAIVQETLLFAGAPAWFIKVGTGEATAGRDYPLSSTTLPAVFPVSGSGTFVRLANSFNDHTGASGASAPSPAGLGLIVSASAGAAKGDVRRITGWHSGAPTTTDKTVDIDRALSATVANTDNYIVGYICEHNTELLIKTEFSAGSGTAPSAQILVRTIPLAQTETGTQVAPINWVDRIIDIYNTNTTFDGGAAFHGQGLSVPCKGMVLATVKVVTVPAAGTLDIWIGST